MTSYAVPANRPIKATFQARPTLEGAGVHLKRAFGFSEEGLFDPFLMLDDFRGDRPDQYRAGFPWHPHRGIETITYLLEGKVEHGDSMGNKGVIGPGCAQWMTAGSGIIHQEMPEGDERGRMGGFQLWANLPAGDKMRDPRYCGVEADEIPVVQDGDAMVRVLSGTVEGVSGPVSDIVIEPEYLDVSVSPNGVWTHPTAPGHTVFAYVFEGSVCFGDTPTGSAADGACSGDGSVVLFGDGASVTARATAPGARFLLVSGKPLGEPIAWRGPIVMNTDEELRVAFEEYHAGTFVKHDARGNG